MKYVSHGPMMVDVHMHKPQTNAKNFMDSLLAFWPGLQVASSCLSMLAFCNFCLFVGCWMCIINWKLFKQINYRYELSVSNVEMVV